MAPQTDRCRRGPLGFELGDYVLAHQLDRLHHLVMRYLQGIHQANQGIAAGRDQSEGAGGGNLFFRSLLAFAGPGDLIGIAH